ncbi:cAMP-binding proteins - catabolite gene activator and regulatory subunit of cAMP-dependent protein kinases [hydrothermal vent metagenome]|uniref:cAMP-binding proteins - catabolite gene activator and regulatory subunit of cAMP-dependent protein kinases n=1 Tax=hydrothermal vent metagenome TaxID=652676 RepID=A0A3B0RSV4_9ZZZZ
MTSLKEEVEVLRRVPLFAQLDPAKLKLLAFASERMTFLPGQDLCKQGDVGDAAYVIISGEADILVNQDGNEIVVAQVGENAVIGEIAVLCEVPRTATVRATTKLQTLKIDKETFLRLIREFPDMGIEIMRELAERLTKTTSELSVARNELKAAAG